MVEWHAENKRGFPWRDPHCPAFQVLVAEILLRKTRGESVDPIWRDLIGRYPTPADIASADPDDLERILQPLGLHRMRALALKRVGEILLHRYGGQVPADPAALMEMPHVGRYAANAVMCLSYDAPVGLVDANIARILSRLFTLAVPVELHKAEELWEIAESIAVTGGARETNLALLDLGALVCTSRAPACGSCPLANGCRYSHDRSRKVGA